MRLSPGILCIAMLLLNGCNSAVLKTKESIARMQPVPPSVARALDGKMFTGHGERGLVPGTSTYAFFHGADDVDRFSQKAGFWVKFRYYKDGEFDAWFCFIPTEPAYNTPLGSPELYRLYQIPQLISGSNIGVIDGDVALKVPAGGGTSALYIWHFDPTSGKLAGQGIGGAGLHWNVALREVRDQQPLLAAGR